MLKVDFKSKFHKINLYNKIIYDITYIFAIKMNYFEKKK